MVRHRHLSPDLVLERDGEVSRTGTNTAVHAWCLALPVSVGACIDVVVGASSLREDWEVP
jgi:hypothetical protein